MTDTPQRVTFDEAIRIADLVARRCQTRLRVYRNDRTGSWLIGTADADNRIGYLATRLANATVPRSARMTPRHRIPREPNIIRRA